MEGGRHAEGIEEINVRVPICFLYMLFTYARILQSDVACESLMLLICDLSTRKSNGTPLLLSFKHLVHSEYIIICVSRSCQLLRLTRTNSKVKLVSIIIVVLHS